jgi:hypothetical protein
VAREAAKRGTDGVGHTLLAYLGRSATFIYTTIRFQTRLQPVLLAERTHAGGIGTGVHYRGVHLISTTAITSRSSQ